MNNIMNNKMLWLENDLEENQTEVCLRNRTCQNRARQSHMDVKETVTFYLIHHYLHSRYSVPMKYQPSLSRTLRTVL